MGSTSSRLEMHRIAPIASPCFQRNCLGLSVVKNSETTDDLS
jgi:hypothetical protein